MVYSSWLAVRDSWFVARDSWFVPRGSWLAIFYWSMATLELATLAHWQHSQSLQPGGIDAIVAIGGMDAQRLIAHLLTIPDTSRNFSR